MKRIATFLLLVIPATCPAGCLEYKVVDHGDRVEAFCAGDDTPQLPLPSNLTKSEREVINERNAAYAAASAAETKSRNDKLDKEVERLKNELNRSQRFDQESDISINAKVYHIRAQTLEARGYDTTVGIKCDVESNRSGNAFVTIVGKDWEGTHLETVTLQGPVIEGRDTTISGTTFMSAQRYLSIREWQAIKVNVYTESSYGRNTYVLTPDLNNTIFRYTSVPTAVITTPATPQPVVVSSNSTTSEPSSSPRDIGGYIYMKRNVTFTHKRHQEHVSNCVACHSTKSGGYIAGFGKDWAHTKCKGCHSNLKAGPTGCKGCHL